MSTSLARPSMLERSARMFRLTLLPACSFSRTSDKLATGSVETEVPGAMLALRLTARIGGELIDPIRALFVDRAGVRDCSETKHLLLKSQHCRGRLASKCGSSTFEHSHCASSISSSSTSLRTDDPNKLALPPDPPPLSLSSPLVSALIFESRSAISSPTPDATCRRHKISTKASSLLLRWSAVRTWPPSISSTSSSPSSPSS